MMITISNAFKTFRKDINGDHSFTMAIFERITLSLFKGIIVLGVPLLIYLVLLI